MRYNKFSEFLVIILIIIECVTLYLMGMSLSSKKTINLLELNNEEILTSDVFAIMLEQEDGTFIESTDTRWPGTGYIYNHDLSGCTDKNGNSLNGVLTYNDSTKVATLDAKTTVSCFLYFNLVPLPPSNFTFYLGGSTNPEYSTTINTTAYLSWNDENITSYCLTDVNNSSNCTWNNISGITNTVNHNLNNTQGSQTWYVFIKNKYNLISESVSDSIILDSVAPTIGNFYLGGSNGPSYTTSTSTIAYSTWNATDVSKYCITTTNSSANCSWKSVSGTSLNESYSLSSTQGSQIRYLFLKDKAGNISSSKSDSITLDSVSPVVTSTSDTTKGTMKASVTENGSGISQVCVNGTSSSTSGCTWETMSTVSFTTTKKVASAGTYYLHVQDKAGNVGHSGAVALTIVPPNLYLICKGMTLSACLSNSEKVSEIQEIANMSDGLSGDMYRYQGKTGTVENNYICFGTTSASTCTSNPSRYMYRIIGINSSGQIRLIKKTSIGDLMWHTDAKTSVNWPNSNLKSLINGSTYLTNTTYVPSGWSNKIATYAWKYGDIAHADYTGSSRTPQESVNGNSYHADNSYAIENAFTSTSSYKVSLMYVTDYFYSHSDTGPGTGTSASTSWLHLLNNEASNSPAEWTMSRKGHNDLYNLVWQITVDDVYPNFNGLVWGSWYGYMCENGCAVRPTFYLTNTLQITSGNGTITTPYILS